MAVFLANVCKFNSCGLKFSSLQELIRHIEEMHLEHPIDPKPNDKNLGTYCLPVSCVLRIFSNETNSLSSIDFNSNTLNESHHARKSINSPAASLSTTPTDGSEIDGDDADSDSGQSSIDSWATSNLDSNTNPLLKFHQIMGSGQSLDENNNSTKLINGTTKEFICGVNGCTKRYRSSNSLSHHRRSACHSKSIGSVTVSAKPLIDESNKKIFKCVYCGKTYKTSHGLKNHCNNHHNNNNNQTNRAQVMNGKSMVIASSTPEIKQEANAQISSFVQINSIKNDLLPVKENILTSISKAKNSTPLNGDLIKLKNGSYHTFQCSEILSDNNCPPVSNNVEVITESKFSKGPPTISAPTLQQHLLSPIVPKVGSN